MESISISPLRGSTRSSKWSTGDRSRYR